MRKTWMLILAGSLLLSACGNPAIEAHDPWARTALKDGNGVVYMVLHNHTDVDDVFLGASSETAQAVEIHESRIGDDGVMQMIPQISIPIAADEELEFSPGGLHVMLVGLKQDLNIGDEIILTLHFFKYEDITLVVPVKDESGADTHNMP